MLKRYKLPTLDTVTITFTLCGISLVITLLTMLSFTWILCFFEKYIPKSSEIPFLLALSLIILIVDFFIFDFCFNSKNVKKKYKNLRDISEKVKLKTSLDEIESLIDLITKIILFFFIFQSITSTGRESGNINQYFTTPGIVYMSFFPVSICIFFIKNFTKPH